MAIPGFQEFMLPIMRSLADQGERSVAEVTEAVADQMGLTPEDKLVTLPSGTQPTYYNRIAWSITHLTKAEFLERPSRGRVKITERGLECLRKNPSRIDMRTLREFEGYRNFSKKKSQNGAGESVQLELIERPISADLTPEEQLDAAFLEMKSALADDLLKRVKSASPKFFEHLVVRLLIAMGYGGGDLDRAEVTGKSGDDGIDGVIREDRLGLDSIYVQAKRWENTVPPAQIDQFVGSLMRKKAKKGVFITSGAFSENARRAAREAAVTVRLIDGEELAELMIQYNVGVADYKTYVLKKVDSDFFEEIF